MWLTTSFSTFLMAVVLATSDFAATNPTSPRRYAPIGSPTRIHARASLQQVRAPKYHTRAKVGALALEMAYLKYNMTISTDLTDAVTRIRANLAAGIKPWGIDVAGDGTLAPKKARAATGSVVNIPEEYDLEYLTPVLIGNPPQTLNLNFDTGSSDLWVYSSTTPASEVNGQSVYKPEASNTSVKATVQKWSIDYVDGSRSHGDVYLDTVSVGGLSVERVAVEVATQVSSEFTSDSNTDGILGLAFSSLNTVRPKQQATFFDQAKSKLDSFVFTADLKAGKPGTYNFGYIDPAAYTGDIYYTPVSTQLGFWTFSVSGYSIGDAPFNTTNVVGIADTGTSLLLLPADILTAYYNRISGATYEASQGGFVIPCNATMPHFTFGIGDEGRIVIPGEYLIYAPIDATNSSCFGGLQHNGDMGSAIFGDMALKAAFVVFDAGPEPQLGWAAKDLGLVKKPPAPPPVVVVTTVTTTVS